MEAFVEQPEVPLSVNLLGVESRKDVARYYSDVFEQGRSKRVSMSVVSLSKYNEAAKKADTLISFDNASREWTYWTKGKKKSVAYSMAARELSPSHAHVQYIRHMDEIEAKKFAREMARHGRATVRF